MVNPSFPLRPEENSVLLPSTVISTLRCSQPSRTWDIDQTDSNLGRKRWRISTLGPFQWMGHRSSHRSKHFTSICITEGVPKQRYWLYSTFYISWIFFPITDPSQYFHPRSIYFVSPHLYSPKLSLWVLKDSLEILEVLDFRWMYSWTLNYDVPIQDLPFTKTSTPWQVLVDTYLFTLQLPSLLVLYQFYTSWSILPKEPTTGPFLCYLLSQLISMTSSRHLGPPF